MRELKRKSISFDLDTDKLKMYYPKKGWNHAYDDIKQFMLKNGFEWQQGSVYLSKHAISDLELQNCIYHLTKANLKWLPYCARDVIVANIEDRYSLNNQIQAFITCDKEPELEMTL